MSRVFWIALSFLLSCSCAARPEPPPRAAAEAQNEIARLLDDWHAAASRADEEAYFAPIAERGVFLGTDATERWEKAAFRACAHPHFAKGKAWSFRAVERHIEISSTGDVAWFDERLETANLGLARGSGVLVREPSSGRFRIAHYNLAITVPNERFGDVKALLAK